MSKKLTTEEFIEKAKKVHEDKYNYSMVQYKGSHEKVQIICPKHGAFWQTPNSHLTGCGCPVCGVKKPSTNKKSSTKDFIEKARIIYGDKYDYSQVKYVNSNTKVKIICPEHGAFWQAPHSHLAGRGCPVCGGKQKLTTEMFIKKARKIHGNKYDYSQINYINHQIKIKIICPRHGAFLQSPSNHLRGDGCPKCGANISKPEEYMYIDLQKHFGTKNVIRQYNSERYPYNCDFYIPSKDMFIELNGTWTHGGHWFDKDNPNDIKQVQEWENHAKTKTDPSYYLSAIRNWTQNDPKKHQTAIDNHLNYHVCWSGKFDDIDRFVSGL